MQQNVLLGVNDLASLVANRFDHPRVAVTSVDHGNAGREVHVALAVAVPEVNAFRVIDEHRGVSTDDARHERLRIERNFCNHLLYPLTA